MRRFKVLQEGIYYEVEADGVEVFDSPDVKFIRVEDGQRKTVAVFKGYTNLQEIFYEKEGQNKESDG